MICVWKHLLVDLGALSTPSNAKHGTTLAGAVAWQLNEQWLQEALADLLAVPSGMLSLAATFAVVIGTRSFSLPCVHR